MQRIAGYVTAQTYATTPPARLSPFLKHRVGLHGGVDRRLLAVLIDEELRGAVDVEGAGHFSVSMTSPALISVTISSLMLLGRNWPCQTDFDGA